MIRVCYSRLHKGDPVFGEKSPFEDKSLTHGLCEDCFEKEMEELERQEYIKPGWRQRYKELEKNPKRRNNMPKERQPKYGDFVLFGDNYWIILEKKKGIVLMENLEDSEITEELLINNLAPTDIKTWEAE